MGIGQIRTLKSYGWLANSAVWINLLIIFISMGFIGSSAPNYESAAAAYGEEAASGPVRTATFVSAPLATKVCDGTLYAIRADLYLTRSTAS
jgi:hypothetical protein